MNKENLNRLLHIADGRPPINIQGKYEYMVGGMQLLKAELNHLYENQFRPYKFSSCLYVSRTVADKVASELSLAQSKNYWVELRGDNGDGDIGYEIRTYDRTGTTGVCNIGVVEDDGYWYVVLDTSEGDIPLNRIDDLLQHLGL